MVANLRPLQYEISSTPTVTSPRILCPLRVRVMIRCSRSDSVEGGILRICAAAFWLMIRHQAYIQAIKHHCPNVTLVIDRFHIVKALNGAVDEVRKEEWRQLDTHGRKAIKGLRWLLSLHSRNRGKGQTRLLNQLRNSNRRIHRAWVLKDEFEHFWNYRSLSAAKRFLKRWMTAALKSRIPSMRDFVGTLRTHYENIITFIERPLTNAVSEGINRIIKIVKNRASGFRNLDSFADLIFLTVGDLDILDQIPSELRSL